MKFNKNGCCKKQPIQLKQLILIMKFVTILLTVFSLQLSAEGLSQNLVTVNVNNTDLGTIIRLVERQSDYRFIYHTSDKLKTVKKSISVKNVTLEYLLDKVLEDTRYTYKFMNKNLVVIVPLKKEEVLQIEADRIITGTITNEKGEPMVGVSVTIKNSSTGTTTGEDGRYMLKIQSDKDILVFSYIGFITQEIPIQSNSQINITMYAENMVLTEVVSVGYGAQRRSDLTGSITSVKGSDINSLGTKRVDEALQGRAAGVLVLNTDGAPGGNTTIRIRGMNSVLGGNNALVVVDGLQGVDISKLNPNDIESIDILKDASATAIYGAQGANGVIIVTTKQGKKGKPVINYDGFYGRQNITNTLPVMSAAQYARFINEYKLSENGDGRNPQPVFSEDQIAAFEKNGFGTNWQKIIYREAPISNHDLSISGGSDLTKYFISAGYLNQTGIMLNSFYKRFNIRANLTTDITKWLGFNVNWLGSYDKGNAPVFGGGGYVSFLEKPSNAAPRYDAIQKVFDENGNYAQHEPGYGAYDTWNPLASTAEPEIDNNTISNNLLSSLTFNILPGLTLKVVAGGRMGNIHNTAFYNTKTASGLKANGLGRIVHSAWRSWQNSNVLTYEKTFGLHQLTLTGVEEQSKYLNTYKLETARDFTSGATGIDNLAGARDIKISNTKVIRELQSYLGRVNYIFAGKYLLTASIRGDGSSVFGANNKWGYFPSYSLAWKASNEQFIKQLNIFSNLKFRYSWGVTGNQAISPYQTFATITTGNNYPYYGTEETNAGYFLATPANPNLKWESTTQRNVGLDIGFFKGRLEIVADFYKKVTNDLLMYRTLPKYTGFNNVIDNVGSMENKGIELQISGRPVQGALIWNTDITLSSNRNKVLSLGEYSEYPFYTSDGGYGVGDENRPLMFLETGKSFGLMKGYQYLGVWKESEREQAAVYGQLPGDPRFSDLNEDGSIDLKDITVIGNAMPKFIFGWSNRFSYKNFDCSFLLQGTQGNDLFNVQRIRLESPVQGTSTRLLERWTPQNQDSDIPDLIDWKTRELANLENKVLNKDDNRSSRWVEDASYLRLKSLVLGYSLPENILSSIKFNSVRFYVSGTNLITWTKYTGYTPEVSSYNENDAMTGVDFSSYPQSRIVIFGINLSF